MPKIDNLKVVCKNNNILQFFDLLIQSYPDSLCKWSLQLVRAATYQLIQIVSAQWIVGGPQPERGTNAQSVWNLECKHSLNI